MQATLDAASLKHVIKALTCLHKYGDDLILQVTPDRLLLHTTNSSSTAYCRFVYSSQFFTRFNVESSIENEGDEEHRSVNGQLSIKALLSVLKHRTMEKSVHKCELSIVDGEPPTTGAAVDEDHDGLESRLIIRLHCRHGVVKTHKLLLSDASRHMAPNVPDSLQQSHLSIGPKAIKDIIDHFPSSRSSKSDPQLIWSFSDDEVHVRSQESSADSRASAQLATELTVGAEEFDTYTIAASPVVIAFHLKEFNAAIAFAESCNLGLNLRFTDPADPLFIEAEGGDLYDTLFIISMSQVTGVTSSTTRPTRAPQPQNRKRSFEHHGEDFVPARAGAHSARSSVFGSATKRPHKAVVPVDARTVARAGSSVRDTPARYMPPPALSASAMRQRSGTLTPRDSSGGFSQAQHQEDPPSPPVPQEEPLFLPSSQLSQADQEIIRAAGLGIEDMNVDEFNAMMDDDGQDIGGDGHPGADLDQDEDLSDEGQGVEDIDDTQLEQTQGSDSSDRTFQPLFDD